MSDVAPVDRIHQSQAIETNKPSPYPIIKDFEEDISRYWQMVFGLERMARRTKDKKLKARFNMLADLAVYEFAEKMEEKWVATVELSWNEAMEDLPELERVGKLRAKERRDRQVAEYERVAREAIAKAQADMGMQEGTI